MRKFLIILLITDINYCYSLLVIVLQKILIRLETSMTYLLLVFGILLLYLGSELLVRVSIQMAHLFQISTFLSGLTVVAFATSIPEAVTSVIAQVNATSDIALGSVIGSNIVNIGLVLGIALFMTTCLTQSVKKHLRFLVLFTFIIWLMMYLGPIHKIDGVVLLLFLISYTYMQYRNRHTFVYSAPIRRWNRFWLLLPLVTILSIILLYLGAYFLVHGAVSIAEMLGVSHRVIAISIVAIGTSLPELATSMVAATKKQGDLILGNVIGSNIFNLLFIIPIASFVREVEFSRAMFVYDAPTMMVFTLLLAAFIRIRKRLRAIDGAIFLVLYIGYVSYLYLL